jgi:hypothetical protein
MSARKEANEMSTRNSLKTLAALAPFTVALALLAGCGSSTTTTATTSPTATSSATAEVEHYRAELKPTNQEIESARHSLEKVRFTGSNYSEVSGTFLTYLAAYRVYIRELEKIHAPISVAKVAEDYVTHLKVHLVDLEAASNAAAAHEGAAVNADLEKAHAAAKECSIAGTLYAEACRW